MKTQKEYRNVIKTRKAIRDSFISLLGEKKNLEEMTVKELCERADIAKSTFYYHYDDLYSISEEIGAQLVEQLSIAIDCIKKDFAEDYEVHLRKLLKFLKENEALYRKIFNAVSPVVFIENLKTLIARKFLEKSSFLLFSKDKMEMEIQIRFLAHATIDIFTDYFKGKLGDDIEKLGDVIISTFRRFEN